MVEGAENCRGRKFFSVFPAPTTPRAPRSNTPRKKNQPIQSDVSRRSFHNRWLAINVTSCCKNSSYKFFQRVEGIRARKEKSKEKELALLPQLPFPPLPLIALPLTRTMVLARGT